MSNRIYLKNTMGGNVHAQAKEPQNSELLSCLGYFFAAVIGNEKRKCHCEIDLDDNLEGCVSDALGIVEHTMTLALMEGNDAGPVNKILDCLSAICSLGGELQSMKNFYVASLPSGNMIYFYSSEVDLGDKALDGGDNNVMALINSPSGETCFSKFDNQLTLLKSVFSVIINEDIVTEKARQIDKLVKQLETM